MKSCRFGKYTINADEIYYLAYVGGRRELCAKDQKEYDRTILLPLELQRNELRRMGQDKNPNLVPVRGKVLIDWIKERKLVPFFDIYFHDFKLDGRVHPGTRILQVNDLIIYESIKAKSYDLVLEK
jgi:hypothetical protein